MSDFVIAVGPTDQPNYPWRAMVTNLEAHPLYFYGLTPELALTKLLIYMMERKP